MLLVRRPGSLFSVAGFVLAGVLLGPASHLLAEPVVPGSGVKLTDVGDDFEDPNWKWYHNFPKSSETLTNAQHGPFGESANGRWYEGRKRGHPDYIVRVETPAGGLAGSRGSLLLRSLYTGVQGRPSFQQQQDDFVADVQYAYGTIPVQRTPSVVTRVFLPKIDDWENRSGCHFAFRAGVETTLRRVSGFRGRSENEIYFPGFFLDFEAREDTGRDYDSAQWRIRADSSGNEFPGKAITVTGWWTLGMSFTPDGAVHYYARPGVEDLTEDDLLSTQWPYGFDCERFRSFFFNVCNGDDGRTWSTEWIIDDPSVYVVR